MDPGEHPFRAVCLPPSADDADPAPAGADPTEADWSIDDIEAAYQRALQAAEGLNFVDPAPADSLPLEAPDAAILPPGAPPTDSATDPSDLTLHEHHPAHSPPDPDRIHPRQIIEVFLFVGGRPLTARQLADLIGGTTSTDAVEEWIAELNGEYLRQQRPYQVCLNSGGYLLQLRPEYDKIRTRVFGLGPRDVTLPQSALEVLAFVAYRQPTTRGDVDESGIANPAPLLRQLLRRQLIAMERSDDGPPVYRTTPRFLDLFGLRSLADLPRPDQIAHR